MNPVIMYLADGTFFFVGLLGALLGAAVLLLTAPGLLQSGLSVLACVSAGVAMLSSTPFPFWVLGWWVVGYGALLVLARWDNPRGRWPAVGVWVAMAVFSCALAASEWSMRRSPRLPLDAGRAVVVIGDSLSAGMEPGETVWPTLLAERIGRPVRNLAQPGARLRDAMEQAWMTPEGPTLVLLEIGGNDLLGGGGTAERFAADLEALLAELSHPDRTLAMMELPLPPLSHGYSRAQRRLARRYGAILIPKKTLADVFRLAHSTVDGLHLSLEGHTALARAMADMMEISDRPAESE